MDRDHHLDVVVVGAVLVCGYVGMATAVATAFKIFQPARTQLRLAALARLE